MDPRVSIIVVNYNAGEHLARCLEAIERHAGPGVEAIVIDNASSDRSLERIRVAAWCRIVRNERNVGFGAAVNQGARAARGPLLLVLNPDCLLTAGALDRLEQEMRRHAECVAVGPCVLNEDGTYQGNARSDPAMLAGLFGRSTPLTRRLPWLAVSARQVIPPSAVPPGGSLAVDWVSGACLLLERDAFERVGGFDEKYFLFWEDADLCRRLRRQGASVRFCAEAKVVHAVGVSRRTAEAASIDAFHRSAERYYTTHVAPSRWSPAHWLAIALLRLRRRLLTVRAR